MTQRKEFEKFWMKHCKENSLYCNLFRNGLDMYIDTYAEYAFKGWQAAKDITDEYNLPPYMKDCKVLMLPGEMFSKTLYMIYCPHADVTTTWREGKHDNSTQTISGE